jgi:beta-lactamase class A
MRHVVGVGALMLGVGVAVGWWASSGTSSEKAITAMMAPDAAPPVSEARGLRRAPHDLIEPLLDWEPGQDGRLAAVKVLAGQIRQRLLDDGHVTAMGLFVRDLKTGASFGFEADTRFTAASLGKALVLVTLLVREEMEPGYLQRRLFYPLWMDANEEQAIAPRGMVRPGHEWSFGQLAEAMIAESDNNAMTLLVGAMDPVLRERVLTDLGLRSLWELDANGEATVTPRGYGLVFRVLYNATYLGEGGSAHALSMLTRTSLAAGLRAGVPAGTVVAHKFGEWGRERFDGFEQQFHDCGIVYRPGRPYLACVMTRGRSLAMLVEAVGEVSRALWEGFAALPPP